MLADQWKSGHSMVELRQSEIGGVKITPAVFRMAASAVLRVLHGSMNTGLGSDLRTHILMTLVTQLRLGFSEGLVAQGTARFKTGMASIAPQVLS